MYTNVDRGESNTVDLMVIITTAAPKDDPGHQDLYKSRKYTVIDRGQDNTADLIVRSTTASHRNPPPQIENMLFN